MDPYCMISLIKKNANLATLDMKTNVQDNVGMHPIWNENFIISFDKETDS
jgi:hypothetical protein